MNCDFCSIKTDEKLILRDQQIFKKDGSDIILCNECLNLYANHEYDELEDRINLLDTMINRIKSYFFFSPLSVRKAILCDSLEKSNETEITEWDLTCKIQSKNSRERCVCNKLK